MMTRNGEAPKVAVVTGGGRGLGAAMAIGLARTDYRVVVTAAHERAEIEAVAEEAGIDHIANPITNKEPEADTGRNGVVAHPRIGVVPAITAFWVGLSILMRHLR